APTIWKNSWQYDFKDPSKNHLKANTDVATR
ncbi:MAG: hypothetical protein ACI82Z_001804, partial [Cellvibrionaceae bacterium]